MDRRRPTYATGTGRGRPITIHMDRNSDAARRPGFGLRGRGILLLRLVCLQCMRTCCFWGKKKDSLHTCLEEKKKIVYILLQDCEYEQKTVKMAGDRTSRTTTLVFIDTCGTPSHACARTRTSIGRHAPSKQGQGQMLWRHNYGSTRMQQALHCDNRRYEIEYTLRSLVKRFQKSSFSPPLPQISLGQTMQWLRPNSILCG